MDITTVYDAMLYYLFYFVRKLWLDLVWLIPILQPIRMIDIWNYVIALAEISVSNLYQNWIKTVSKLCLIQFWYSFSVSNLYQKLFDIILIVSNLYQNCIKCVSEVWYNLILSNWYQNCIKSDCHFWLYQNCIKSNFVIFWLYQNCIKSHFIIFDSIKSVSNRTLSLLTLSKLYQIKLCHLLTLSKLYQITLYHFWLYQIYIKSDFIIFAYQTCIKTVSNWTLHF